MTFDTGNPVPSKDPRDLVDNAEKMDEAVNGTGDSWTDRLGNERPTLHRLEEDYPQAGVDADRAEAALSGALVAKGETEDLRDEAVTAKNAAQSSETAAAGHESAASGYAADAESARDAAITGAIDTYADTAAGLAGTSEGDEFKVPSAEPGEIYIIYEHKAGPVAEEVGRTPSASAYNDIETRLTAAESEFDGRLDTVEADISELEDQLTVSTSSVQAGAPTYRIFTLPSGTRIALPTYAPVEPIDLFMIAGQSNAEGRGDSGDSPAAPRGIEIDGLTITSPLSDPVGGADTGSMWPAFSNEWFAQTARYSAFVDSAAGGTGLLPDAGGQWSPAGALRDALLDDLADALSAISSSTDYEINNIYIMWVQGEADGNAVNGTTVTESAYESALEALADYLKTEESSIQGVYVIQTGTKGTGGGLPVQLDDTVLGWEEIRAAQADACNDNANLNMAFEGTFKYLSQGLEPDGLHYGQEALNEAGLCAARRIAGASAPSVASGYLGSTAYPDLSGSNKLSRTESHTIAVGAGCLVVAVATARHSSGAESILGATFDGVEMGQLNYAVVEEGGGTGDSNLQVAVFYLTAAAYGGDLAGVTGDIVVTSSNSMNTMHLCAIELGDAIYPQGTFAELGLEDTDSSAVEVTSSLDSVVISVAASLDTVSNTCAWTNATEIMDATIESTPASRFNTCSVAYSSVSARARETITATFSSECDSVVSIHVPFRARIAGEG